MSEKSLLVEVLAKSAWRPSELCTSDALTGGYFWQEVQFESIDRLSNVFQAQVVIHCVSQFLLASQVMLGGLN
jgi:hypothetical protein